MGHEKFDFCNKKYIDISIMLFQSNFEWNKNKMDLASQSLEDIINWIPELLPEQF